MLGPDLSAAVVQRDAHVALLALDGGRFINLETKDEIFQRWRYPKMDDLGVPPFQEMPRCKKEPYLGYV
jgi:hypothetical protein